MPAIDVTTVQPTRPTPRNTGHYLLGHGYRAYSAVLMRFNSPDSLSPFGKGGLNAYAYCLGDPQNRIDPSGHFSWFGLKMVRLFAPRARAPAFKPPVTGLAAKPALEPLVMRQTAKPPLKPASIYENMFTPERLDILDSRTLTELRKVSLGVKKRVDDYSAKNFDELLKTKQRHWMYDEHEVTPVEKLINAGAGAVRGVTMAEPSLRMSLSKAKALFAATHDYPLAAKIGIRQREEYFQGENFRYPPFRF